jgi:thiol-disulfide isomerase/thioredoxin
VIAIQGWLWFHLLRQNGRILARLQEVEQGSRHAQSAAMLVGAAAPTFDLHAADRSRLTLEQLLARGRPVMLVFGHAGCGPCQELLPQLASWQHHRGNDITVALVSEGVFEAPPALGNIAVQIEREVADAYGVTSTPAAILIGPDGTVASPLVVGAGAIAALVPEQAARPEEATPVRRDLRVPLGLTAAGTVLATAGPAAARVSQTERDQGAAADDPELLGLRVVIKLANPRLAADAREVQRALRRLAQPKPTRAARAAAQASLRRERAHILALRASLEAVPTSGARSREAKQLAVRSLFVLAEGLHHFSRAVATPDASDSSRHLEQAAKPLQQARSLGYAANIVLGCSGKEC